MEEDYEIKDGRTIISAENIIDFLIIKELERDLHREDLSKESKNSIKRGIEKTVTEILDEIDSLFHTQGFFRNARMGCYRGPEEGIDIDLQDYLIGNGGLKVCPEINMRLGEEDLSLSLSFNRIGDHQILSDLLQIHSSVTGKYDIKKEKTFREGRMMFVSPVIQGPEFLKAAQRLYNEFYNNTPEQFRDRLKSLRGSYREGRGEFIPELEAISKGLYARELLEFLKVKLDD